MKLHPEDPRLTACVLGELSAEDAAAVTRAAAVDPTLQTVIRETEAIQQILTCHLSGPVETLLQSQRDMILRRARELDRGGRSFSFSALREALQVLLIPACAAAVLALTSYILLKMPQDKAPPLVKTPTPKVTPPATVKLPTPSVITPPPLSVSPAPVEDLPVIIAQHGAMAPADFPTLDLPVHAGKLNLPLISKTIRDDRKLPSNTDVRLEEILNAFPLRLSGVAAISRAVPNNWHPDNRDTGMTNHVATLSTEIIACPWKPSANLLFVSIHGNALTDCDVRIAFHANPENVFRYRLLGYASGAHRTTGSLPSKVAAKSVTTIAIEIEPAKPDSNLGTLEWSTNGNPAPSISVAHRNDADPSDDARFAALVCSYAQWLAGEQVGNIDKEILAALAREIASATLSTDRADFLNLIDTSLQL